MSINPEQLGRIRGISLNELRVRSCQRFAILSDRLRRGRDAEMSDDELFGEFNPVWRGECVDDALRRCLLAKNRRFLPSLEQRKEIVEVMNWRFPDERDDIINTAEAALAGIFSLLGHIGLSFGDPPDSPETDHANRLGARSCIGASCISLTRWAAAIRKSSGN